MATAKHLRHDLLAPAAIHAAHERLKPWIVETPIFGWHSPEMRELLGEDTHVEIKLELFQNTNTFKPRGALNVILNAEAEQLQNGIVAASGGNHGIAVAYAAKMLGYQAKIVIPASASPLRRQRCIYYGAEVIPADNFAHAIETAQEIQRTENRLFVHPHEGPFTVQGAATVAAEWAGQTTAPLDAVIVAVGGGGLIAGIGSYFKQIWPNIKVYGAEPAGAPTLHDSVLAHHPIRLDKVETIADSLAMSAATPYTFKIVEQYVDEILLLSDDDIRHAMLTLFNQMKLVTEPACAIGLAALLGPLHDRLAGQRVGLIACGSNLDIASFAKEVFRAEIC